MSVPFIDIHTHHPVYSDEIISVHSIFLQDIAISRKPTFPFSAGIHPWHADKFSMAEIKNMLEYLGTHQGLIAIGETGLDKKCQVEMNLQKSVFKLHIEFAEKYNKPLIIHCVNSWNEIIDFYKKSKVQFILHSFHANKELTRQLIRHGFCFSIGKSILEKNVKLTDSIKIIPAASLFFETDEEILDIRKIYDTAASILECTADDLKNQIFVNYNRIFQRS